MAFADKRPLPAFFALLGIFLLFIIAGNFLRTPKQTDKVTETAPKAVTVFGIGESPKVELTAKVEKSGVVTIVAQTPGIVQGINVTPGVQVGKGTGLVWLSTNYQGGSIPSAARQIAQKNYDFVVTNYDVQKEMIGKRREIANKLDDQAAELREISDNSISDTKSLISLNEEILTSLNANIAYLESTNVGGANDAAILEAKSGKTAVLAGINGLKSGLEMLEYQTNNDQEPAELSRLSRDLTNKQLDLEERSLDLTRELSRLNLLIARISEAMMYPVSPVAGTVERVHVNIGQNVNPGDPLVTVSGNAGTLRLTALVGSDIARGVSKLEPSVVQIGGKVLEVTPLYVSREPTDGALHAIVYVLPDYYAEKLTNATYVTVEVPMQSEKSVASVPFVPLDAVFQTQTGAYVFVASSSADANRVAVNRPVTLGEVVGSFVRIAQGLASGDQIILDRNVVAGDHVTIQ